MLISDLVNNSPILYPESPIGLIIYFVYYDLLLANPGNILLLEGELIPFPFILFINLNIL